MTCLKPRSGDFLEKREGHHAPRGREDDAQATMSWASKFSEVARQVGVSRVWVSVIVSKGRIITETSEEEHKREQKVLYHSESTDRRGCPTPELRVLPYILGTPPDREVPENITIVEHGLVMANSDVQSVGPPYEVLPFWLEGLTEDWTSKDELRPASHNVAKEWPRSAHIAWEAHIAQTAKSCFDHGFDSDFKVTRMSDADGIALLRRQGRIE